MSRDDDFESGLEQRRKVLGDAWVDRSLANTNDFNRDFQSLITRYAWNEIWNRPGLDHKTRRLLVLATMVALGRWEEFDLHLRAAVEGGVPIEEIKEVLLQSAIYCGVPAANTAFAHALSTLKAIGANFGSPPRSAPGGRFDGRTSSRPVLRYAAQGEGPPVVFSHALGCDLSMWDDMATALEASFEVLRYDHRGHGTSETPPGPYSMDDLVDDAARAIGEWGCGPVVWVGLSMGGMVGQGLATRHPEMVRGLVIANSTCHYPDEARAMWQQRIATVMAHGMAGVVDTVIERYFHERFRGIHPATEQRFRRMVLATDASGYVGCCHAIAAMDFRAALPRVKCPTLVIAGEFDQGAPVSMSRAIAALIPGARLEIIEDASHLSAIEQPEAFLALLRTFLGSLR
jgi:3-oxoadipate enol-lactonase